MSSFSNFFSGLKDLFLGGQNTAQQFSQLNPQQEQALSQLLGLFDPSQLAIQQQPTYQAGQSYLQSLLGGDISQFSDPYMRQFKEQTIPGIAEQFAGLGGLSSSGFQQALGGAAAGLQERLASLRGQLQMQALPQALGYAQAPGQTQMDLYRIGLSPTQQTAIQPGQKGILKPILSVLAKAAAAYAGAPI